MDLEISTNNDSQKLDHIDKHIRSVLAKRGVPVTTRNVIHIMFGCAEENLNYADWLESDNIYPACQFETRIDAFWRVFRYILKCEI